MKSFFLILFLSIITLSSSAQFFGPKYSKGVYYTIFGQEREGLILINSDPPDPFNNEPSNVLFFKKNKDAEPETIRASTLKAVLITGKDTAVMDSFIVVHRRTLARIKYSYDFIQVIIDKGPVNLYKYRLKRNVAIGLGGALGPIGILTVAAGTTINSSYYNYYYYYGENAANSVELKRKTFIDAMSSVMADDPEIVSLIQNKTYTLRNIDALLSLYRSRHSTTAVN